LKTALDYGQWSGTSILNVVSRRKVIRNLERYFENQTHWLQARMLDGGF